MSIKKQLQLNSLLDYRNNLFYQKDFQANTSFENAYLGLRQKENRIYSDEVVKNLPEVDGTDRNKKEWDIRKSTLQKLTKYLKRYQLKNILELGCGNGWLSFNLATSLDAELCAVDINEQELQQGARVFRLQQNLSFVYADIASPLFNSFCFDAIILSASIQYFPGLENLVKRLLSIVSTSGQIFIADSPLYPAPILAEAAKKRSITHFESLGFPAMADQYFHHTVRDLLNLNYEFLYNPKSITSLVGRRILRRPLPVFPIICIRK